MRNLSKTVDRILKIEPALENQLLPIKTKWEKTHRHELYWKQLLKILNTEITPQHPKRFQIQSIFVSRKKAPKKLYTFEPPSPAETIVGTIPEHMDGLIRKHDHLQVEYAKKSIEARMTHNETLMIEVLKKCEKLEIEQKKLWLEVKNYFSLWSVNIPTSFFIRSQGPLLVLTAIKLGGSSGNDPGPQQVPGEPPEGFMIKMDNDMLRKFFRFFNISPPPGLTPPESG